MPIEILMPALSPTMTEGNLAKWHKKEGDKVKSGDVLAEIETDKATMEVEAVDEGTLGKVVVPEGAQGVKANAVIALLLEEGEDAPPLAAGAAAGPSPTVVAAPPALRAGAPSYPKDLIVAQAGNLPYTEIPHTGMRRTIARRMVESKQNVPHFNLTVDCEIDALLKIRAELNEKSDAYKISVNDFVIRAAALTMRKVPRANASWSDDAILQWNAVDCAVAVALPDGLITPI